MKTKKPLVVDSSIAVKWVHNQDEKYIEQADKILENVQAENIYVMMPELAKYEVGNALLYKQMSLNETLGSLATYHHIPIQFIAQDEQQAKDAMRIAYENKITFYDASFIALAKDQKADLVTDNPKHQNKYKGKEVRIVPLKNYI